QHGHRRRQRRDRAQTRARSLPALTLRPLVRLRRAVFATRRSAFDNHRAVFDNHCPAFDNNCASPAVAFDSARAAFVNDSVADACARSRLAVTRARVGPSLLQALALLLVLPPRLAPLAHAVSDLLGPL